MTWLNFYIFTCCRVSRSYGELDSAGLGPAADARLLPRLPVVVEVAPAGKVVGYVGPGVVEPADMNPIVERKKAGSEIHTIH